MISGERHVNYAVMFVEDSALPGRHDWALVRQGQTTMLFMRDSVVHDSERWEAAWRGANLLANKRLQREHGIATAL